MEVIITHGDNFNCLTQIVKHYTILYQIHPDSKSPSNAMIFIVKHTHHSIPELSIHIYIYLYYLYIDVPFVSHKGTQRPPKQFGRVWMLYLGNLQDVGFIESGSSNFHKKKAFNIPSEVKGPYSIHPKNTWDAAGSKFVQYPLFGQSLGFAHNI